MRRGLCAEADKIWALRYIREAKAELSLARELGTPETTRDIAAGAIMKAQLAVQHALGQSEHLDLVVAETTLGKIGYIEPPVRILFKMREAATTLSEMEIPPRKLTTMETAGIIVKAAESIVRAMTAE